MKTLRDHVAAQMVLVHRISRELADRHVANMSESEVARRLRLYARTEKVSGPVFREAKGAIGNLTTNGMEDRAGKPMPVVESFPGSGAEPQMLTEERLSWARELIRRAREGWPEGESLLPLRRPEEQKEKSTATFRSV